jgi:hypothetical protein
LERVAFKAEPILPPLNYSFFCRYQQRLISLGLIPPPQPNSALKAEHALAGYWLRDPLNSGQMSPGYNFVVSVLAHVTMYRITYQVAAYGQLHRAVVDDENDHFMLLVGVAGPSFMLVKFRAGLAMEIIAEVNSRYIFGLNVMNQSESNDFVAMEVTEFPDVRSS